MKTAVAVTADFVIDYEINVFENGWIIYDGKTVKFQYQEPQGRIKKIYKKNTVLFPALVNAHTHLELSLMDFNPEKTTSFDNWLLWIISNRQKLDIEEIKKGVKIGKNLTRKWGTGFIGDISSFGVSEVENGMVFHEIIGNRFPGKISLPISIHAIYSTSVEVIKQGARLSKERNLPFQMHIGESYNELLFARGEKNVFESRIYPTLGRKRFEHLTADSVIDYIEKCEALCPQLIAVHCTNLTRKELEKLMNTGAGIVICPRSNLFLKTGFPNVEFIGQYEKAGIGTDGLSSNTSLSLLSEIKTLYFRTEGKISLKNLLYMATTGGARTLGIEETYRKSGIFTAVKPALKISDPFKTLLMDDISIELFDLSSPK
ncbi:amidohydrolase family protein [Desulfurobacterium atlanticum]|uniref:Cytosine/adenosine deaminase n=1 Tax=Desulfurobacterium atlanticum TaxID=240169 RepID=A0A238XIT3_9BACT|nr:amidohydrolase family protein [Desulfurobacterium atlanticum]SNR58622.1 Cytosine/adenosine deaminase [Desulfurobacterium atlanticum]